MRSRRKITVSLLESAGAPAHGATRGLASVGWKIRPFSDLTAFLIYVKMNRPEVTIVPHRGQRLNGLKIAQRLRDLSPSTSVIIALQPCHSPARSLLSSSDLVSLIRQRCIAKEGAEIQGNGSMQWKGGKA